MVHLVFLFFALITALYAAFYKPQPVRVNMLALAFVFFIASFIVVGI